MRTFAFYPLALCSVLAFGACADGAAGPSGPGIEIAVAPLQLAGIGSACYDLTVTGATGPVVSLTDICSDSYGNGAGGGISYVAPCDASPSADTDTDQAGVQNTVTIKPKLLDAGGNYLTDWQDPCGADGCSRAADCDENADTSVVFNLTIMRNASQGFFDVAVNFEDIFCSAKLDSCTGGTAGAPVAVDFPYGGNVYPGVVFIPYACENSTRYFADHPTVPTAFVEVEYPDLTVIGEFDALPEDCTAIESTPGTPINLLFGDNGRQHTAVAALACTAGAGTVGTVLDMTNPRVRCNGNVTFNLALGDAAEGNHVADAIFGGYHLKYALYFGAEDLQCDGASCQKLYYNVAINIGDLAEQGLKNCALKYGATATSANSTVLNEYGELTDLTGHYPAIVFGSDIDTGVPLTSKNDSGPATSLCVEHPLNRAGSSVQTIYVKGGDLYLDAFYGGGTSATAFSERL